MRLLKVNLRNAIKAWLSGHAVFSGEDIEETVRSRSAGIVGRTSDREEALNRECNRYIMQCKELRAANAQLFAIANNRRPDVAGVRVGIAAWCGWPEREDAPSV